MAIKWRHKVIEYLKKIKLLIKLGTITKKSFYKWNGLINFT